MTLFLDRVDSAPLSNSDFPFDFNQWVAVLVDTLNEVISDIQNNVMSTEVITSTTFDAVANSLYVIGNAAQTTVKLPEVAAVGTKIGIAGFGAGGWVLEPFAGQTIQVADVGASATTSITSASQYDSIEIVCVEEDTTWITLSTQTTGFVIV